MSLVKKRKKTHPRKINSSKYIFFQCLFKWDFYYNLEKIVTIFYHGISHDFSMKSVLKNTHNKTTLIYNNFSLFIAVL